MNTVGKILVLLNFLFAIIVGAFLVVDFAMRTSWKAAHDKLAAEIVVITADRATHVEDGSTQRATVKDLTLALEKAKTDMKDAEDRATAEIANLNQKATEEQIKAKDADLSLKKIIADVERLKTSEVALKDIIKEREKAISDLQESVKSFRTNASANELLANQVSERNQQLLEELAKVNRELAQLKAGVGPGGAGGNVPQIVPVNATNANPPTNFVKGKVERVDPTDSSLVLISVGTDQGVNNGNTMEVFRTVPGPKYLGMIRIVDASPRESVGRLVVPLGAGRPQLQTGDNVWSQLRAK